MESDSKSKLSVLDEPFLAKALEAVRAKISKIEHDQGELQKALAAAREEEQLLHRLLVLRQGGEAPIDRRPKDADGSEQEKVPYYPANIGEKHPVVEASVQELAAAGRPLHVSELMRILKDRNVSVPGAGIQANLIAHLRRDRRVVRPSRGMYGLAAWGLESMDKAPKRRKKRRIHSKATG